MYSHQMLKKSMADFSDSDTISCGLLEAMEDSEEVETTHDWLTDYFLIDYYQGLRQINLTHDQKTWYLLSLILGEKECFKVLVN